MQYINKYFRHISHKNLIVVLIFGIAFVFKEHGYLLAPFFILGAGGDSAGGGGSGGGGGGDCASGSCSGNCGCNTADCGGGECSSGCGGGSSTPFLCVWDGTKYVFENDVLVAPKTLRGSRAQGEREYARGDITSDTYHIERALIPQSDGSIRLQLKEVEPEESYLDHLALTRLAYPSTAMLVSNPEHNTLYAFDRKELMGTHGVEKVKATLVRAQGQTAVEVDPEKKESEIMLEPDEYIELSGTVTTDTSNLFVLVRSRYRDWTAGVISEFESTKREMVASPYMLLRSPRTTLKMLALLTLSGFIWLGGMGGKHSSGTDDVRVLGQHFNTPVAHADACHSLVVAYFNWKEHAYREVSIVQPRHYTATLEASSLPPEAVSRTGEVRVRITATKRHAVSLTSLFSAKTRYDNVVVRESLTLTSAKNVRTNEEYTAVLNERNSGAYMHIVPSDVVELAFSSARQSVPEGHITSYTFEAAGFYTPLSAEGRVLAGDWVPRLDTEAQSWLREMYSLKDYRKEGKKPVLTV